MFPMAAIKYFGGDAAQVIDVLADQARAELDARGAERLVEWDWTCRCRRLGHGLKLS